MDPSNPMSVRYFTYKVEFQARGAGHIHGTLWLNLLDLEKLVRRNGRLVKTEEDDPSEVRPLKGLAKAFKKLKHNEDLNNKDCEVLKCFADEFNTNYCHHSFSYSWCRCLKDC